MADFKKPIKQEIQYDPLSFGAFLNDISRFRSSGTKSGSDFNHYDTPTKKYFKVFFYFWNGDVDNTTETGLQSGGLLAPLWEALEDDNGNIIDRYKDQLWRYTSAWTYLRLNDEVERANKLKYFVELLSNISTESPWYFSQIEGLSDALDRPQTMSPDFKFDDARKKISIKCLPDAYDDRISTLLDLYKEITWSWKMKRMILPSNLKKFDMGIYIFESPIANIHNSKSTGLSKLGDTIFGENNNYATINKSISGKYLTSYKYIEFHNCEIDYNSGRSGLQSLDNKEGTAPEYTIDIFFDDCYENRYNEFLMQNIGDMISIDYLNFDYLEDINGSSSGVVVQKSPTDGMHHIDELYNRSNIYDKGPVGNAINELTGAGVSIAEGFINKIKLGNLYTGSLSKIKTQFEAMTQGHLWSTVQAVKQYTENKKQADTQYVKNLGNFMEELGF